MPRKKLLLAEYAPELSIQYDPSNPVPFDEVLAHGEAFRWRCQRGHTWSETAAVRPTLPAWKRGDVLECRECTGEIVTHSCGHQKRSRNNQHPLDGPCSSCLWEIRRAREGTTAALVEDGERVDELAAEHEVALGPTGDGPATLVALATNHRRYLLRGIAARSISGADADVIRSALAEVALITPDSILPPPAGCASVTVVGLDGLRNKGAWGPGLALYQGHAATPALAAGFWGAHAVRPPEDPRLASPAMGAGCAPPRRGAPEGARARCE